MRALFVASLVLLIASSAMLIQTRRERTAATTIDRSFLGALNGMPVDEDAPFPHRGEVDTIAGEHEAELIYLVSKGDAGATRAMVLCTLHNLGFGGCECTKGRTYESVYWDGPRREFWTALRDLPPRSQARVLAMADRFVGFETEFWRSDMLSFLAIRDDTEAWLDELSPETLHPQNTQRTANADERSQDMDSTQAATSDR